MLTNHITIVNRVVELDELANLLDSIRESYAAANYYCKVVLTSGYFLVLHDGHIDYLRGATRLGNIWVTIVNGDEATKKKYGKLYVSSKVRASVISSLKYVHYTVIVDNDNIAEAIRLLKPDVLYNGGDRTSLETSNKEEIKACKEVKCEIKFGKPNKINSSADILNQIINKEKI